MCNELSLYKVPNVAQKYPPGVGLLWPLLGAQRGGKHVAFEWCSAFVNGSKCVPKKTFIMPLHHHQAGLMEWIWTICMVEQKLRSLRSVNILPSSAVQFWWFCTHCRFIFQFLVSGPLQTCHLVLTTKLLCKLCCFTLCICCSLSILSCLSALPLSPVAPRNHLVIYVYTIGFADFQPHSC